MKVAYQNWVIYHAAKIKFPIIVDLNNSNNTSNEAIHNILKLRVATQNKKVGKSRNFEEKVGKIEQIPKKQEE